MIVLLLASLLCINIVLAVNLRVDPLVVIDQGIVRGQRAQDGEYSTFLGIPYAEIDVVNPFGAALPPPKFASEVFDAFDGSALCPQPSSDKGSLDCLHVNIYVPNDASSQNLVPVFVWIHGGAFIYGKAEESFGPNLVSKGVIMVTLNYRLGPYGFLCLDVPSVPGNQGLKDQFAAMEWIKNNIQAFGGDPNDITLAGQSAGGGAVVYHMYSNQEKMFHKAIIQSGVPQSMNFFVESDLNAAKKIAEFNGFNTTETSEALQFLATIPVQDVLQAYQELDLEIGPCKEKSFSAVENIIEDDPYTMSNPNKINNITILIGTTSNEEHTFINAYNNAIHDVLKKHFNFDETTLESAANLVRHFYMGDNNISEDTLFELENFRSDFAYNHPTDRTIMQLIKNGAGNIYEYVFSYVSENDTGRKHNAPHTAEIKYLFATLYNQFDEIEKLVSDCLTELWVNFIKHGNPTPETNELIPVKWDTVTADTRPYLLIESDITLEHRFRAESMTFWDLFYLYYGKYNKFQSQCRL